MNFRIEILDTLVTFPSTLKRNGSIYLDLEDAPVLSESSGAVSDISKIGSQVIADITLKFSPANDIILARWRKTYTNASDTLKIHCSIDGAYIPFDILTVTNVNYEVRSYTVQIKISRESWVSKAEETTFNNINFESYEFLKSLVIDSWTNLPAGDGLFFPVIQYGNLMELKDGVKLSDLRPWFQLDQFLKTCFCAIGYQFDCPFLSTTFGQKLYWYALGPNFGKDEASLNSRKFTAKLVGFQWQSEHDPNNLFDGFKYTGTGRHDFHAKVKGSASVPNGQAYAFELQLFTRHGGGNNLGKLIYDKIEGVSTGGTIEFNLELHWNDLKLDPGEDIRIVFSTLHASTVINESSFYNEPLRVLPLEGDIVTIKDNLRGDNILQLLKGLKHLIAGKIDYDPTTKTVSLLTQYDADVFGESIIGFYTSAAKDYKDAQIPNATQVAINKVDEARYLRIGFAKSTDLAYQEVSPEDDLFARIIDRGSLFAEKTKDDRNPYFEPTLVKDVQGLHPLFNIPPVLGHCITEDSTSFDIAPRIGIANFDTQRRNGTATIMRYESQTWSDIATIIQEVPIDITIDNWSDENLTYGSHDTDLFSIGWQWESALRRFRKLFSIRLFSDYHFFKGINFKDLALFFIDGRTVPARIEDKSFDENKKEVTLSVIPQRASFDDCGENSGTGAPPDIITNDNLPQITINFDEGANTVNAVANNTLITSPIDTDTWEYSTDGVTWNPYTPGTNLAGDVSTTFRRTVTYSDGSSDQTVVATHTPSQSCNNTAGLDITYIEGSNSASASKTQSFSSTVDTDTLEVNINGGGFQNYTENDILDNFTTLVFRRTVTFVGACPDIVVEQSVNAPINACNNYPVLGITEIGDCVIVPEIAGSMSSSVAHVLYQVSEDGGTTWVNWNQLPINKVAGLKLKATIFFCDSCPKICLEYECT